jgi:F-box/WD-40 domain protein 7
VFATRSLHFKVVWHAQVCVWDVQTLKCRGILTGHTGAVFSLADSSGTVFSGGFDTTIKVWDSSTSNCLSTLLGHENTVVALAVADGHLFSGSKDKTMRWGCCCFPLMCFGREPVLVNGISPVCAV